jgi:hypothetical protein
MLRLDFNGRRWFVLSALGGLMAFQFGAPRTCRADWEDYQHDPAHTGYTASSPDPLALVLDWSAPIGYATPLIVGNTVIGTHNGQGTGTSTTVSSFNLSTGAINWSYKGTYTFPSQAAYGNGLVALTGGLQGNLTVLNASTGALKYTVPSTINANMPLMVPQSNGTTIAYLSNGNNVQAVSLGATSGSILWTTSGEYGGLQAMPTLVGGNTLIVAGPGQYYAINTATGAQNHFQSGNIFGGGGDTVVFDASRNQFYVSDSYNSTTQTLTAYHFGGAYNQITMLWQKTGTGIGNGQVALDANGNLYAADTSHLVEIDPATGNILRSVAGSFARDITPIIAGNDLWVQSGNSITPSTLAYDLSTLGVVRTLPGSSGDLNNPFTSPGVADDSHFILDYGDIYDSPGFDVYAAPAAVPEPATVGLMTIPFLALLRRRRRATQAHP